MGKPSRDKGRRGEQELAKLYKAQGYSDCYRTPNSGGLQVKGDLQGVGNLHIEVKRIEKLNIWKALQQAVEEAEPDQTPALHFRRNSGSWYVALPLESFFKLLHAAND